MSDLEIERRYLCRLPSHHLLETAELKERIDQGYLTRSGPAIRVRRRGERTLMTVKTGGGFVREEVEWDIPADVAERLFRIAGPQTIEKVRYRVGPWEIDVFEGKLRGLVVAEVELDAVTSPLPAFPEGLDVLLDVTEAHGFTNQLLAALSPERAAVLIRLVDEDVSAAARVVESWADGE